MPSIGRRRPYMVNGKVQMMTEEEISKRRRWEAVERAYDGRRNERKSGPARISPGYIHTRIQKAHQYFP
jgi:hypothetical protein